MRWLIFAVQVVVGAGGALRYSIGRLSYESPTDINGPLSKPAMFGVIAGILLLMVIFVAFLIAYRRKSTESNRVLKNMQEQMDILELRVAAECKEGTSIYNTLFEVHCNSQNTCYWFFKLLYCDLTENITHFETPTPFFIVQVVWDEYE